MFSVRPLRLLIRLSTKLLRLKQGPEAVSRDGELEDTIQELEARVVTLESQKGTLQSKLNLAKQHILDLGVRAHNRPRTGEKSQLKVVYVLRHDITDFWTSFYGFCLFNISWYLCEYITIGTFVEEMIICVSSYGVVIALWT